MADKILTEAFDKLKAIEESEDPFCIGAKDEDIVEAYTEVVEADDDAPYKKGEAYGKPGYGGPWDEVDNDADAEDGMRPERESDRVQPDILEFETDSGDHYVIEFQEDGQSERGFVEANGISVASFTAGGAGSMNARIQKPDEVINMLVAAMQQIKR